jgi:hypothetical protein
MVEEGAAERRDEPDAVAVGAALARLLESDAFRAAPQLSAFLSFIVESALAGRAGELKGYTIATEALGRPSEFDPQADPIVRVEAGRLRKALAQYDASEGAADPVRIAMPVGGYAPVFEWRAGAPAGQATDPAPPQPSRDRAASRRWLGAAAFGLVLGLAALVVWHQGRRAGEFPRAGPEPATGPEAQATTASVVQLRLPVVAVSLGEAPDPALGDLVRRFARLLVDAMARFDDRVTVVAPEARSAPDAADYVFELNISRDGQNVEGFGRLRAVRGGRVVWTGSTARDVTGGTSDSRLAEIARRLAIRLAEPFGVIHADVRQVAGSPAMRCLFDAVEVRRTMKPQDHLAARDCIGRLLEQDRNFHPAWSQLALLILDEHASGLNPLPGPPLDRALGAALNAARLAPSSARAQQVMMDVLFARGETEDALEAGRKALAANPYDPEIMADFGARLVQLNRPAEGLPLLERAIDLSAGRPPWYDFFAFLGAHLTGAERLAESYAAVFATDDSPLSLLGLAMRSAANADQAGLKKALGRLVEVAPLFGVDPRLLLGRKGFQPQVVDAIMTALGPAAIDLTKTR